MSIVLPELPYDKNALAPYISANTLDFHYGKHHNAYVVNTNNLIKGTELEGEQIESIIIKSAGDASRTGLFNNAAQVWNHTFYWNSMKPNGGGMPSGDIAALINKTFGSYDKFIEEFKNAGVTQFGSGWAWLVLENGILKIVKTGNADTPLAHGQKALITVDVWEHAYYLDYQNRRPDYLGTFIEHLINWDWANRQL
jgi:Fe-Mn family superoxide dismutase